MISETQAADAVDELSGIRYFPRGDATVKAVIIKALCAFVGEPHQLRWLVDTANNHMREWMGIAELRALYCKRFTPADGVAVQGCLIEGFTDDDCETAYRERVSQRKFLPATGDTPVTDEDKKEMAKLIDRKVELGFMDEVSAARARKQFRL